MRGREFVEAHEIATAEGEGADGFAEAEILHVRGDGVRREVLVALGLAVSLARDRENGKMVGKGGCGVEV